MNRAERDAAVEQVVDVLTSLWLEHKNACKLDPCPTTQPFENALKNLYSLRKSR